MTIEIITSRPSGIMEALMNMGFEDFYDVIWVRSPVRINGVWRCEVQL